MSECRAVLAAAGLVPSAETEAIYRETIGPRLLTSKGKP
jgi:hypothetical protein